MHRSPRQRLDPTLHPSRDTWWRGDIVEDNLRSSGPGFIGTTASGTPIVSGASVWLATQPSRSNTCPGHDRALIRPYELAGAPLRICRRRVFPHDPRWDVGRPAPIGHSGSTGTGKQPDLHSRCPLSGGHVFVVGHGGVVRAVDASRSIPSTSANLATKAVRRASSRNFASLPTSSMRTVRAARAALITPFV
jgi:hypothetical protein